MTQKVIKVGSSIGVVLPKETAKKLGFKAGQEVTLTPEGDRLVLERVKKGRKDAVSKTVAWAEAYIDTYREDFEKLADL